MSFDDFLNQLKLPAKIRWQTVLGYGIRFFVCLFTMEWVLHHMYVVAIKDTRAWQGDTPFELSMIGFWNLIVVWLKVSMHFGVCRGYSD